MTKITREQAMSAAVQAAIGSIRLGESIEAWRPILQREVSLGEDEFQLMTGSSSLCFYREGDRWRFVEVDGGSAGDSAWLLADGTVTRSDPEES